MIYELLSRQFQLHNENESMSKKFNYQIFQINIMNVSKATFKNQQFCIKNKSQKHQQNKQKNSMFFITKKSKLVENDNFLIQPISLQNMDRSKSYHSTWMNIEQFLATLLKKIQDVQNSGQLQGQISISSISSASVLIGHLITNFNNYTGQQLKAYFYEYVQKAMQHIQDANKNERRIIQENYTIKTMEKQNSNLHYQRDFLDELVHFCQTQVKFVLQNQSNELSQIGRAKKVVQIQSRQKLGHHEEIPTLSKLSLQEPTKKQVRKWKREEIISYAVFIARLKQLFQYSHYPHLQRLYIWLHLYIKITNQGFNLTVSQVQVYHHKKRERNKGNLNKIISSIKLKLEINELFFKRQLQSFNQKFPQVQAVLQFYSTNNLTENYKENCLIAQNFFAELRKAKGKSPENIKTSEWTRLQYLTYVAFLQIQKINLRKFKRDQFDELAEFRFEGNVEKLWNLHRQFVKCNSKFEELPAFLTNQWKLTNQDIELQKQNIIRYLKLKDVEQIKQLRPSTFESFLANRKTINLRNQYRILTDSLQLVSTTIKCFIFNPLIENEQNDVKISKKSKRYHVYLVVRFQLDSQEQIQVKRLRQNYLKLKAERQKNNQIIKYFEQNSQAPVDDPIKLQENRKMDHREKDFDQQVQVQEYYQKRVQDNRKINRMARKFDKKSRCQNFDSIEVQNYMWMGHYNKKFNQISEQFIKQQQNYLLQSSSQNKLDESGIIFNGSFQSTEVSFSREIGYKQNIYKQIPIQCKEKVPQQILHKIEQEICKKQLDDEQQLVKIQCDNNRNLSNTVDQYESKVSAQSIEDLLENIVSEEQQHIFKSIFSRKTLEHRLMNSIISHQKKIHPITKQAPQRVWGFNQNLKFVSFLIMNKLAFTEVNRLPANTYNVMSEFIGSRNPFQCDQHYFNYNKNQSGINMFIKHLINQFSIPLASLKREINKQKRHYLSLKGKHIFQYKKSQRFQSNKSQFINSLESLLIEQLENSPLVFNLKIDHLTQGNEKKVQLDQIMKGVSWIEKERYLNCLEQCNEKSRKLRNQKLMQFAPEIFKEREGNEQYPLLKKYHQIMMSKHKCRQKILQMQRKNQKRETPIKRKNQFEMQIENNLQLMENLFQRSFIDEKIIQLQILRYLTLLNVQI